MGWIWGLAIVAGPVLLGLVLAFAIWRNKQEGTAAGEAMTERATKQLHDEIDREDKLREGNAEEDAAHTAQMRKERTHDLI